jgi:putative ATPase
VFVLKPLSADHLRAVLDQALADTERGLGSSGVTMTDEARDACVQLANGDARSTLNAIEVAAKTYSTIDLDAVKEVFQKTNLIYDKAGDEHYNVISAFIKSMRGSDPDGTLYWLARMLEAGEDPMFVARRMVVLASEDVGVADVHALPLATSSMQAVHMIGMPEARILLAHVATYLALAPKSNATYMGMNAAMDDAQEYLNLPIPLHLRNAPTKLMKGLGYGKDYLYTHDHADKDQEFLPDALRGKKYYKPSK